MLSAAPSPTRNRELQRDLERRQTRQGAEWQLWMKLHIGVGDATGVLQSGNTTGANAAGVTEGNGCCTAGLRGTAGTAGRRATLVVQMPIVSACTTPRLQQPECGVTTAPRIRHAASGG